MFTAYQGFSATYERFRGLLNRAGQARRQKDIQELRGQGLVIQPALLEILDAGQDLQDYLNFRHVSGASPGDPAALKPFLDRLENAAKNLEAARAAGGREGLSKEALAEFRDQLQVVLNEAAHLAGDGETAGGKRISPENLAKALGRLVDIYNLME
ncbi:MAG: YiiG family protein [Candidatus Adiutrix sp.]|nr:YiiG family protein [Candidatus Adiutrix sp.]